MDLQDKVLKNDHREYCWRWIGVLVVLILLVVVVVVEMAEKVVIIHAKSGRLLRYISAIFFGFSAKF